MLERAQSEIMTLPHLQDKVTPVRGNGVDKLKEAKVEAEDTVVLEIRDSVQDVRKILDRLSRNVEEDMEELEATWSSSPEKKEASEEVGPQRGVARGLEAGESIADMDFEQVVLYGLGARMMARKSRLDERASSKAW